MTPDPTEAILAAVQSNQAAAAAATGKNTAMTIEYRVKPVTRYIVTRHETSGPDIGPDGVGRGVSSTRQIGGEHDNADVAYEVGYALARQEAEIRGYAPGDERMQYPTHPGEAAAQPDGSRGAAMTDPGPSYRR